MIRSQHYASPRISKENKQRDEDYQRKGGQLNIKPNTAYSIVHRSLGHDRAVSSIAQFFRQAQWLMGYGINRELVFVDEVILRYIVHDQR